MFLEDIKIAKNITRNFMVYVSVQALKLGPPDLKSLVNLKLLEK